MEFTTFPNGDKENKVASKILEIMRLALYTYQDDADKKLDNVIKRLQDIKEDIVCKEQ